MGAERQAGQRLPGPWRVASTYIGTVVGAGFASGQEILRFFTAYDGWGTLGLLGVAALLAAFGVAVMRLGAATGAESHRELVRAVGGRWLGTFADWVITGFLFAGTAVMIAGSSAIFREQLGWPGWAGSLVMAAAATVTVLFRLTGVTLVTSLVAPVLIASALLVSGVVLARQGWPPGPVASATGVAGAAPVWPLAALLYASFNLVLAMPVLAPLGAHAGRPGVLTRGGLLGGAGLGVAALALHLALWAGLPATARFDVPMLALARQLGQVAGMAYAVVLWLEVYTTAVTSLYGVAARLRSPRRGGYGTAVVVLGGLAFAASFFGFAQLVTRLYPLVGYLGLVILATIAWRALELVPGRMAALRLQPAGAGPAGEPVPAPATAQGAAGHAPALSRTAAGPAAPGGEAAPPAWRPSLRLLATRALTRAATALGALLGTAALAGGGWPAASVPELAVWMAAALGMGLTGALVADRIWLGAALSGWGAAVAGLGEFGLGSLLFWTGHYLTRYGAAPREGAGPGSPYPPGAPEPGAAGPLAMEPISPADPLAAGPWPGAIPWPAALVAALAGTAAPVLLAAAGRRMRRRRQA